MKPDIYSEQYNFEWEHRSYLISSMNHSTVIITIIGGGLVTISRLYDFSGSFLSYAVATLLVSSFVALGFAVISVFRAMGGYEYARVPRPNKLIAWRNELENWHSKYGNVDDQLDEDFDTAYLACIGDAVEVNATNNRSKSAHIHRANIATAAATALLFIPAVMFVVQDKKSDINVELVTLPTNNNGVNGDHKMSESNDEPNAPEAPSEAPSETPPEAPPPKPAPPTNEFFKENKVPPTRTDKSD